VADPGRGKSGHGPPSKLAMEFAPLRSRRSNDSMVNLLFPYGKMPHLNIKKVDD